MKIAYFDTVGGVSGDMCLGAFVSAGVQMDVLSAGLAKLPVGGFELRQSHVKRNGIDAVHIDVVITEQQHHHRHYHDITELIEQSGIPAGAKAMALKIFALIGNAEAVVHGTTLDRVHFHEVGAIDSIVDIVGTAFCLDLLGIEAIYSSPIKLGSGGTIDTQHGTMPVPAPATMEILKGYPAILTDIPYELTTPTGAAIICALSRGILRDNIMRISRVGYGTGAKEFTQIPNLLRIAIADLPGTLDQDEVVVVETNIDDMNPQVYPHLIERLLAAGAHDAFLIPIIMKKGRPGILLSVLADRSRLDDIAACIYSETTSIGVRVFEAGRWKLPRRLLEVQTSFGTVRAKAVIRNGKEIIQPEFDECRRIAGERQLPVLTVQKQIERELSEGMTS